ncbi:chemotaxis protein CheB [Sulfitobacter sp. S190]|uniref:chemotaxis protein CheB n=1 Tax=Sulfitobacter sp. S190 TaxID=2867022 RepID=UPI0021A5A7FE|nr:chemotaxis protein CheB [Sulfitobacter sp. S190]UWR21860.1 chemotaxis protein CheB [Sulfitobacter sp. S190]
MSKDNTDTFVVAIGASAGGLTAVVELLRALPEGLNAPIVIAIHSDPSSRLDTVLQAKINLPIVKLETDTKLEAGTVYVVPGATHALFRKGSVRLSEEVSESGFRPSIDALFMTLAAEYQDKAVAVVLSGLLKDGMRGAQVVYDMGGRTIVQNPEDAIYESMPRSVINSDHPAAILSATELGEWLCDLIGDADS